MPISSARSNSRPSPRTARGGGRGGGGGAAPPQLVRQRWPSTESCLSYFQTSNAAAASQRPSSARDEESPDVRVEGRGRQSRRQPTPLAGISARRGRSTAPSTLRASARGSLSSSTLHNTPQSSARTSSRAVSGWRGRGGVRRGGGGGGQGSTGLSHSASAGSYPQVASARRSTPSTTPERGALVPAAGVPHELDAYLALVETEKELIRQDNLRLRQHLANRQLLAEALHLENQELMQAQLKQQQQQQQQEQHVEAQRRHRLVPQTSTGSMTDASLNGGISAFGSQPRHEDHGSSPLVGDSFAGPSPPISPRRASPAPADRAFSSARVEEDHELPLHPHATRALQDRLAQLQSDNAALRVEVEEQKDELQRLRALEHKDQWEAKPTRVTSSEISPAAQPSSPPHLAISEEGSVATPSLSPPIEPSSMWEELCDAKALISDLRDYIDDLQRHHAVEQKLAQREREVLQEQLDNATTMSQLHQQRVAQLDSDVPSVESLLVKLHALHAMADQDATTIAVPLS